MAKKKKCAFEPVRWTIEGAASEFGLNPRTVATRLKAEGILPGKDKRFATADIHRAICGDYEKERTRKMKEDADRAARENAAGRGELLDKQDFVKRFEAIYTGIRQRILSSGLLGPDKDALLGELTKLHSI